MMNEKDNTINLCYAFFFFFSFRTYPDNNKYQETSYFNELVRNRRHVKEKRARGREHTVWSIGQPPTSPNINVDVALGTVCTRVQILLFIY